MNVRDLMTESPAVCTPDTGLQDVAKMMVEHDCGAIPVIENEQGGKPVGIITDRDITIRTVAKGQNPLQQRAADAMTHGTETVRPSESVDRAAQLMEQQKIRRLVVVDDDDTCVGIVAQADLARHTSDDQTGELVEEISEPSKKASEASRA